MNESYISRLPPETLGEVFRSCLADCTPLFLGKVCATWRNIIWSTPELWSSVFLGLSSAKFDLRVVLLDEWLARSGLHPLSIHIETMDDEVWAWHSPADVIRVIAPYTERWHDVDLALPVPSFYGLRSQKGRFPLLTSIAIRSDGPDDHFDLDDYSDEESLEPVSVEAFCLAPQLTHIQLQQSTCLPSSILFPWHQLTHFSSDTLDDLAFLRQIPKLTHCTIGNFPTGSTLRHPVLLSHLVSLTMNDTFLNEIVDLLKNTTFPALRELAFLQITTWSFPFTEFLDFLTRSSCSLERLQSQRMVITGPHLIECLRSMPSLLELDISIWNDSLKSDNDLILEQVTLPNLRSFTIGYGGRAPQCGYMLNAITLPSVESISMQGFRLSSIKMFVSHTPLLGFLTRCAASLQCLSFDNLFVLAPQLLLYLQCVPSLVELKIKQPKVYKPNSPKLIQDDIIPLLRVVQPNPLLPNLRVFEYRDAPYFDGDELENMLASRWRDERWVDEGGGERRIARLSSVTIVTRKKQEMDLSARLRGLIGEGLSLSVTTLIPVVTPHTYPS